MLLVEMEWMGGYESQCAYRRDRDSYGGTERPGSARGDVLCAAANPSSQPLEGSASSLSFFCSLPVAIAVLPSMTHGSSVCSF